MTFSLALTMLFMSGVNLLDMTMSAWPASVLVARDETLPMSRPDGEKAAELTGVQHKYSETCLFFAAAAQTCHAYCT